jgi:hypothetical protein
MTATVLAVADPDIAPPGVLGFALLFGGAAALVAFIIIGGALTVWFDHRARQDRTPTDRALAAGYWITR